MILGRITGKLSTHSFKFKISGNPNKFEYVQVMHKEGHYVLAQIIEIEKDHDHSIAYCNIIGYRDKSGLLKPLRTPLEPNTEVLVAEDEFVKDCLGLESKPNTAYIGTLEGRDKLKVYLDLNKLLTKHVVILAKSGMGKSVLAGDIIEDLIENMVPAVIFDPHGEYNTLKYPNPKDKARLERFGVKPKGYITQVQEFTPDISINPEAKPLKLSNKGLTPSELMHLLPAKLTNSQKGTLYSAMKSLGNSVDLDELIFELEATEESSSKWTLINILEYVKKLDLFSDNPTLPGELVKANTVTIVNLKGVAPEVQEVVAYKVVSDLFTERKKGNVPPFFLLLEEAHNFCPERAFGETKASAILRQIASEGRKFGLGMGVVSQRPSRVDKCLHPDTRIITEDSEFLTLKELDKLHKKGVKRKILAYDFKSRKIVPTKLINIAKNMKKEKIYNLKTGRGYNIKSTGKHRFFTVENNRFIEKEASKLRKNDLLLVSKKLAIKKIKLNRLINKNKNSRKDIASGYVPQTKSYIYNLLKEANAPKEILESFSKLPEDSYLTTNRINSVLPYIQSNEQKKIKQFLESDIGLDKIKSIEIEKPTVTYDLETEHRNFIANYIVTHNSVISQASTQFILKVTNPNDLKALSSSVEGMTAEAEKEIKNIPIGTALVTGIVDVPLFVNIRPRRTKHGGEAVKIFNDEDVKDSKDFRGQSEDFNSSKGEILPVIMPKVSKKDMELMADEPVKLKTVLLPCVFVTCNQGEDDFNMLIDLNSAKIITDTEKLEGVSLKNLNLEDISPQQNRIFQVALKLGRFKPAELFAKSGVQFSELYDLVTILTNKGYFVKDGEGYRLNDKLIAFSNLSTSASYEKPDFARIEPDEKLETKFDFSKIREFLAKFVRIKNFKECYLVRYEK